MSTLTVGGSAPVHIESIDFKLRPGFRETLAAKARALFRRHSQLQGLRLRVRKNETGKSAAEYAATAQLVLPGYNKVVVKRGRQLSAVVAETLEVAGRQLRKRARALRAKNRR